MSDSIPSSSPEPTTSLSPGNECMTEPGCLFRQAVEFSPVSVVITDAQFRILYVNSRFTRLTGYSPAEILGRTPAVLKSGNTPSRTYLELREALSAGKAWRGEFHNRKRSGELYWEAAFIVPAQSPGGGITHYIGLLEDLSERKRTEQLFTHLAYHDALTDLPNQSLYHERLETALADARRSGGLLAVVLLDLDRFKLINETLGHPAGDRLIRQVGERLASGLSEEDTLARRGGGSFMLLLTRLTAFRDAAHAAQAILDAFKDPFSHEGREIYLTASFGISLFPEDGADAQTLLQNADAALYDAKDAGRNAYKFFKLKNANESRDRLELEHEFRSSLMREEFQVYYQPQVSVETGEVVGMEALVRWQHPERGLLSPDRFIPLAEETGLIVPLGKWVLATACAQTRAWQEAGLPPLRVSVNLSARQFLEPELVETVLGIIQDSGLDPCCLELELTESILMKDINLTDMTLRWLHKKGIRIAIDDFGTGYSSLMYLKRFPIDTLKIDRSFMLDVLNNEDNAALVAGIASLSQNLKLSLVAEGIETPEQLNFLRRLKCPLIQGYLFSPPLPTPEFTDLLRSGRRLDK